MRTRTDRQAQVLCDFDFGVALGPLASPKSTPLGRGDRLGIGTQGRTPLEM
jgi:hypothetical protein